MSNQPTLEQPKADPGQLRDDIEITSPKQAQAVNTASALVREAREAERNGQPKAAERLNAMAALHAETAPDSAKDINPFLEKNEPMLHRQFNKGLDSIRSPEEDLQTINTEAIEEPIDTQVTRSDENESIENRGGITNSRITTKPQDFDSKFTIEPKGRHERYLHKGTDQEAFRDTGRKIIVKPESRKLVAADVAKLADSKGWTDIKVTGNVAFRRDVWKEANLRGIEVDGYEPTEQDKRDLDGRLSSIEAVSRENQSQAENRAIAPKVEPGTIGESSSPNPEAGKRRDNLAASFKNEPRNTAIAKHPELKELYNLEKAASQFAEATIKDKSSQERFVSQVRNRGLDELSRGNKIPDLKTQAIRTQQARAPGIGR